jgi:hypothetical protein
MKVANLNSAQSLNYWWHGDSKAPKNLFFDLFLFLVCFVALQVIAKGGW